MKKKIGFVPMDPALGAWLLEMLAKEPPESDNAAPIKIAASTRGRRNV